MSQAGVLGRLSDKADQKVRVMLVDDSAVVRGLLSRWLDSEDNIEVVARCHNGVHAVKEAKTVNPTIIILDIEMPEMDGLEALPLLLEAAPRARVLIASSLSLRNAEISLTALSKGAHDYVTKPSSNSGLTTSNEFRVDLIAKINALCIGQGGIAGYSPQRVSPSAPNVAKPSEGSTGRVSRFSTAASARTEERATPGTNGLPTVKIPSSSLSDTSINPANLRSFNRAKPDILCIGSSTGGPRAVQVLLSHVADHISNIPVVITQHMPGSFTSVFANHLAKALPVPVSEAKDGELVLPGHVYVAPGDRHLMFKRGAGGLEVALDDGPEVNFCKPAVDNMFMSAQKIFGNKVLSVILTGMGQDGAAGGKLIADAGGNVLAQDAKSSIVWGMPGAAYKAGICSGVFPLDQIGAKVIKVIGGGIL